MPRHATHDDKPSTAAIRAAGFIRAPNQGTIPYAPTSTSQPGRFPHVRLHATPRI